MVPKGAGALRRQNQGNDTSIDPYSIMQGQSNFKHSSIRASYETEENSNNMTGTGTISTLQRGSIYSQQ
jgi:hypothetical protein